MNTYRRYQAARDAAWEALLRMGISSLPVDMRSIMEKLKIPVLPFPESDQEPRLYSLLQRVGPAPCISLRLQGIWHIFLRQDLLGEAEMRFALAHEWGHILLHHETCALAPGVRMFQGRENAGDLLDDPQELDDYAADIFAIRLLAPACVLHELYIDTPGGVTALCGLPPRAAILRAERMELLNRRDAFLTHPLERKVRDQFSSFIFQKKAPINPTPLTPPTSGPAAIPVESQINQSAPPSKKAARFLWIGLLIGAAAGVLWLMQKFVF